MMLRDSNAAIARSVDALRLGDQIGIEPVAAIGGVRILGGEEVIEFHSPARMPEENGFENELSLRQAAVRLASSHLGRMKG